MSNQLIIRLPEEEKMTLEVIANNRQLTISEVTRIAIRNYLTKEMKSKDNLFLRLAKIGKTKKVNKAPKDLSFNYKKYLYKK